jgi:hypothetical protein
VKSSGGATKAGIGDSEFPFPITMGDVLLIVPVYCIQAFLLEVTAILSLDEMNPNPRSSFQRIIRPCITPPFVMYSC